MRSKIRSSVIAKTIMLGSLFWVLDGTLDYLFFYKGSFLGLVFTNIPPHELYIRLFWFCGLLIVGVFSSRIIKARDDAMQDQQELAEILRSVRNVNQLLVKKDDKSTLIQGVCDNLYETRGFHHVWIALLDEDNKLISASESGLGERFESMLESLESGPLPKKVKQVLAKPEIIITEGASESCENCPLAEECKQGTTITRRLEYDGQVYGLISACVPKHFVKEEELSLFEEVVGDLAFGLHDIEIKKQREKTRAKLQSSKKRFKEIFNNANDAIYLHELNEDGSPGQFIEVNDVACEMLGYSRDEFLSMSPQDIDGGRLAEGVPDIMEELVSEDQNTFEMYHKRKDGSLTPVEISSHVFELDGEERVLSVARDIRERRKRMAELDRSRKRYKTVFENTGTAMMILEEDTNISLANKKAENLTGYTKEELEGTSWTGFVAREEKLEEMKKYHYHRREKPDSAPKQYEFKLINKNGNERDVLMTVNIIPGTNKSVASMMDITERRKALERLEQQKREKSILIKNLPGMAYTCENDRDWTMRFVSDGCKKLTGYEPEELVDNSLVAYGDLIVEEDRQEVWKKIQESLDAKQAFKLEYRIQTREGELKWVWERGRGLFDKDGQVKNLQGVITDITDSKEAERKLRESEKKFRSYVENAPVGVFLVGEKGNYLEVNEAAGNMTGYSKEELLEMSVPDLHPEEAMEDVQQSLRELLEIGETEAELPYLRKDGTKGYFVINAIEISEDRYLGFTLDITKRKEAEKKLEETTFETLQALNRTIEAKDEYTGEHIDRVQNLSVELGKKLGLSDERLEQLRYASILHDIGKIGIPDSILGKPDQLTEDEWEEMEKHPEIGERIVGQVDQLKRAAKIIGQHQEKYDGSGYPNELLGEEITLEARIVAVADAWDAMRTDRPYRDALPEEEALKELQENAGAQFDPEVVEILVEMIEEEEIEFGGK